jgi:uncharacterized membrane-anchored protein
MMKQFAIGAFIIIAIVEWFVPGKMIWDKEAVLRKGKIFNFRTEPVDPSHPFKGRYIALSFKENAFTTTSPDSGLFNYGDAYVLLEKDGDGFAKIKNVVKQKPLAAPDYVQASISYIDRKKDTAVIHLQYPFDEFYMDEFKAPKAETVYRESTRDSTQKTYAIVSILNGDAVIKDVMINDQSIRQAIRKMDSRE